MEIQQQKSYEWIINAINSSNNPFHIECCRKLIELYQSKFDDVKGEMELLMVLYEKNSMITSPL
jgi:hypothetical protein